MKRVEVKAGDRFNDWIVIEEVEPRITKGGRKSRMIRLQCKCGAVHEVNLVSVKLGKSKMCRNCSHKNKKVEVKAGQVFGSWTVIEEVEPHITKSGKKMRLMYCRCECGEENNVLFNSLVSGTNKQCRKCSSKSKETKIKTGQVFGHWTILGEVEPRICFNGYKRRVVHCRCDCGTEKDIALENLTTGISNHCSKCGTKERDRNYRISKGADPDVAMTPRLRAQRDLFFYSVRANILSRDNYKCQLCFDRAKHVHHIIPWSTCNKSEDEQLRFDPENCICLCKECHLKAHDGCYNRIDDKIAEQLLAKAIENTEKNFEYMKGLKEKALKKLAEIH